MVDFNKVHDGSINIIRPFRGNGLYFRQTHLFLEERQSTWAVTDVIPYYPLWSSLKYAHLGIITGGVVVEEDEVEGAVININE